MKVRNFAVAFAVACSATFTSARAEGFDARAIVAYQNLSADLMTTSGFRQSYDLRLEKALTQPAMLRFFVRAEDFRGRHEVGALSGATSARGTQIQPGGEFIYSTGGLHAELRHDALHARSENGAAENSRKLERTSAQLTWSRDRWPRLSIDGSRYRSSDDASTLDTSDALAQATLDYRWSGLTLAVTERMSVYNDGRSDFARRTQDHQALLGFDRSFFDGKFVALANLTGVQSRLDERVTGGRTADIPIPVAIARALYAVDDTPLDNRDRPLLPQPGLTDRNFNASAGIALGPDSPSFHNIGFDLGRFTQVDEFRIHTRDTAGNPVRAGGGVQWDLYRSEDGTLWTPLPAQVTFDLAQSMYVVRFEQMTARWLKVVSFGAEAERNVVTETESFYHSTLAPDDARRTELRFYGGTSALSFVPVRWLSVSYNGLFNASEQEPDDSAPLSLSDLEHQGSIQVDPFRWLSLAVRYNTRSVTQSGVAPQGRDTLTGLFRLMPTQHLDLSLEVSRQQEDSLGRERQTDILILHTFARILPSLHLRANVGREQQHLIDSDGQADREFVDGVLTAQLTRSLRLLLDASMQRSTYEGAGPVFEGFPLVRDDRMGFEVYWRPGQPLAVGARIGRVSTADFSAVTQRYRFEWYPFTQGTVSLGATYDQDIDPYANRRSSRLMLSPRWMMNRYSTFDLNYTLVSTTGRLASRTRSFYATLTLTR